MDTRKYTPGKMTRRTFLRGTVAGTGVVALGGVLAVPSSHATAAPRSVAHQDELASEQYAWSNVDIGGGGYVLGVVIHPAEPDLVYLRIDVGGAYRWDPVGYRWLPITDMFGNDENNLYGIESLALDPSDPDVVYIAAGKSRGARPHDVLKSTDRGKSWSRTGLDVDMWGNGPYRWAGERLAVDPSNGKVVYFGSRFDGLWRSTDGAASWERVASFPTAGESPVGISFVRFGKRRGRLGAPTRDIFVGVWGEGVYFSGDGGDSWELLSESPKNPTRDAYAHSGVLYVSHTAGVARYDDGAWTDVTPSQEAYSGVTVHPKNPDIVMASTKRDTFFNPIYRSIDGGESWSEIRYNRHPNVPWWPDTFWSSATSSLAIDPHSPDRVWYTDWFGTWRTDDVTQDPSNWHTYEQGHEETVVYDVRSMPSGAPLLSGVADVHGFRHTSLNSFPDTSFETPQDTVSIDFCEADPNSVVRVGERRSTDDPGGYYSTDNGATWSLFPVFPKPDSRNGRIAVSATNSNVLVWAPMRDVPYTSVDRGRSWVASTGAPAGAAGDTWAPNRPLVSDRVDGNTFYLYDYRSGSFYRTEDAGTTWNVVSELPSQSSVYTRHFVASSFEAAGHVWVSLDSSGLYYSTNAGDSFDKLPNVQRSFHFALGRNRDGVPHPSLYVYGTVVDVWGIFRSDDLGASWVRIDSFPAPAIGTPRVMEGDRNVHGKVYVGTGGRGIYYGQPLT